MTIAAALPSQLPPAYPVLRKAACKQLEILQAVTDCLARQCDSLTGTNSHARISTGMNHVSNFYCYNLQKSSKTTQ
jgi:hypothetical protein